MSDMELNLRKKSIIWAQEPAHPVKTLLFRFTKEPWVQWRNPGPGKWMLYHDGLTQWWTPESQDYIRMKGWYDRQVKCCDPTNADNRYRNKTVGDGPEFCRGLDAYGFSDLKAMTVYMRSITSMYDDDDP